MVLGNQVAVYFLQSIIYILEALNKFNKSYKVWVMAENLFYEVIVIFNLKTI